jgi:hypothetical protein
MVKTSSGANLLSISTPASTNWSRSMVRWNAFAAVLMAAGLAPMNEKVTRLAVAVSASAMQQGNTTLADLTQLMLSARSQVLTEMIPGRQQIGAGCGHPGPSAEVMAADSLFAEWVLFWQKAFRVAVMKDLN